MPPVAFRVLLPLYNDAFPIMFVTKIRQDSIMTRSRSVVSNVAKANGNKMFEVVSLAHWGEFHARDKVVKICRSKKKALHIVIVKLDSPLLHILRPTSTNIRGERVAQCVRTSRRDTWIGTVVSRTGAGGHIRTRILGSASGVSTAFGIARSLQRSVIFEFIGFSTSSLA